MPNQWVTTSLDLKKLFGEELAGTYCVSVSNYGKSWQTKQVLLQVTDLGVTGKKSEKSILLWVSSLRQGTPIKGCSVSLLSLTGRVVDQGVTDEKGTVLFKSPFETDSDERPFIVKASFSGDEAFLVFSRMDLWDRDKSFGTRDYPKRAYEAWVWSERGVYRPPKEVNVYAVVGDRFMCLNKPFPVGFEIIRPDGKVWKTLTGSLSPERVG